MTRFYFDVRDGDRLLPDDEGTEFPSLDEARKAALVTLGELVKDAEGALSDFTIIIRASDGHELIAASLVLRVQLRGPMRRV
jgi:hypothetical protein